MRILICCLIISSALSFSQQLPCTANTGGVTPNFGFQVPSSNACNWGVFENQNWALMDTLLTGTSVLTVVTGSLPVGTVGTAYGGTVNALGGTVPYIWTITSGSLPAGLTMSTGGVISGTPTAATNSSFTVQVVDSSSPPQLASRALSITVLSGLTVSTGSLPVGTVGTAYSATLTALGGTAPYAWALSAGSMPAGLSLSSGGAITGTPTTAGQSNFTVQVTDSSSPPQIAFAALSITIQSLTPPTIDITNYDDFLTFNGPTYWKAVCFLPNCSPGGTGSPSSTFQAINNSTPSLDGESMEVGFTTIQNSTNVLWVLHAGTCNNCVTFTTNYQLYIPSATGSSTSQFEFDVYLFDTSNNREYMWGMQWNRATCSCWQIFDQQHGSWISTSLTTALSFNTWHQIQVADHRILSDTNNCGTGIPCEYYDSVTIDNNAPFNFSATYGTSTLPTGWAAVTGTQVQMNVGTASACPGSGPCASEYIDEATFTAN